MGQTGAAPAIARFPKAVGLENAPEDTLVMPAVTTFILKATRGGTLESVGSRALLMTKN